MPIGRLELLSEDEVLSRVQLAPSYDSHQYIELIGSGVMAHTTLGKIWIPLRYQIDTGWYLLRQGSIIIVKDEFQQLYGSVAREEFLSDFADKAGPYYMRMFLQCILGREYTVLHGDDRNQLLGLPLFDLSIFTFKNSYTDTWQVRTLPNDFCSVSNNGLLLTSLKENQEQFIQEEPLLVVSKEIVDEQPPLDRLNIIGSPRY